MKDAYSDIEIIDIMFSEMMKGKEMHIHKLKEFNVEMNWEQRMRIENIVKKYVDGFLLNTEGHELMFVNKSYSRFIKNQRMKNKLTKLQYWSPYIAAMFAVATFILGYKSTIKDGKNSEIISKQSDTIAIQKQIIKELKNTVSISSHVIDSLRKQNQP